MECLFLTGTSLDSCAAESDGYTPTSFELKEYCLKSRHILCPFYYAVTGAEYPAGRKKKVLPAGNPRRPEQDVTAL